MFDKNPFSGELIVDKNALRRVVTSSEDIFDAGNMLFADDSLRKRFGFISSVGRIQTAHSYGNFKRIYGKDDDCCFFDKTGSPI